MRSLLLLTTCLLISFAGGGEAAAQSNKKTKTGIKPAVKSPKALSSKLNVVRDQKAKIRRELRRTQVQTKVVREDIKVVDARLERITDELDRTTGKLESSKSEQATLSSMLATSNKRLEILKEQIRSRIRQSYLKNNYSVVSVLAGTKNMTDLISRQQIMEAVAKKDRQMFDEYRQLCEDVRKRKLRQDSLVSEIRDLKNRQQKQQNQLEYTKEQKRETLQSLQAKSDRLKSLLAQLEADERAIESQIAAYARRVRPSGSKPLPAFSGRFGRPASGPVTSGFGMRVHPVLRYRRMHQGVDIGARYGSPIYAAADGEVVAAEYSRSYGNMVILAHGGGMTTVYAHASRLMVRAGQTVKRGQQIAAVGSTGLSSGPHLHFEVRVNGRAVNPQSRL